MSDCPDPRRARGLKLIEAGLRLLREAESTAEFPQLDRDDQDGPRGGSSFHWRGGCATGLSEYQFRLLQGLAPHGQLRKRRTLALIAFVYRIPEKEAESKREAFGEVATRTQAKLNSGKVKLTIRYRKMTCRLVPLPAPHGTI